MRLSRRPMLALVVVAIALVSFGLGLVVANRGEVRAPAETPSATTLAPAATVRILIDPSRVELLPDASLRLDLPSPPDAGASRSP